jgi:hypothetical protein
MQKLYSVEYEIVGLNLKWEGSDHSLFRSEENHNKPVFFSHDLKRVSQNKTVEAM